MLGRMSAISQFIKRFAPLAALCVLLVAQDAQAGIRPGLAPKKQQVQIGGKATLRVAAVRGCVLSMPGSRRSVIRPARFVWSTRKAGVFRAALQCGRKRFVASITVQPKPVDPSPGSPVDPVDPEQPKDIYSEVSDISPQLSSDQLEAKFKAADCKNHISAARCQKLTDILAEDFWQTGLKIDRWYAHGNNPYDTSTDANGYPGGICANWVDYKRPDIKQRVIKFWLNQWIAQGWPRTTNMGGDYLDLNWGYSKHWTQDSAYTTWAVKAGFRVDTTPEVGAVMLLGYNHVAYVEEVHPPTQNQINMGNTVGTFTISEMNLNNQRGIVSYRTFSATPGSIDSYKMLFIH